CRDLSLSRRVLCAPLLPLTLCPVPALPRFPYTTLFRSVGYQSACHARPFRRSGTFRLRRTIPDPLDKPSSTGKRCDHAENHAMRSEAHTSELQSPDHIVCRLLLERANDSVRRPRGGREG